MFLVKCNSCNLVLWKCVRAGLLLALAACSSDIDIKQKQGKRHPWHAGSERPYVIRGVKYYPQMHYQYCAIGYASWYGDESLGSTATGRPFNPKLLTAAHRTLPLPCVVIVENLSNHRKIRVLVNDRGPFAQTNKRIIDLSKRAADILGFTGKGECKVKVTCLPKESQIAALRYRRIPYPTKPIR